MAKNKKVIAGVGTALVAAASIVTFGLIKKKKKTNKEESDKK